MNLCCGIMPSTRGLTYLTHAHTHTPGLSLSTVLMFWAADVPRRGVAGRRRDMRRERFRWITGGAARRSPGQLDLMYGCGGIAGRVGRTNENEAGSFSFSSRQVRLDECPRRPTTEVSRFEIRAHTGRLRHRKTSVLLSQQHRQNKQENRL